MRGVFLFSHFLDARVIIENQDFTGILCALTFSVLGILISSTPFLLFASILSVSAEDGRLKRL